MFHVYGDAADRERPSPCGRMSGTDVGRAPFQTRPMFWRMNDMPIAVISGASRGALRNRPVGDDLDRRVDGRAERHRDQEHEQDEEPEHRARLVD